MVSKPTIDFYLYVYTCSIDLGTKRQTLKPKTQKSVAFHTLPFYPWHSNQIHSNPPRTELLVPIYGFKLKSYNSRSINRFKLCSWLDALFYCIFQFIRCLSLFFKKVRWQQIWRGLAFLLIFTLLWVPKLCKRLLIVNICKLNVPSTIEGTITMFY